MSNFTAMAIDYPFPLPGYEPQAEVVTFPHLRRQTTAVLVRHAILAEQINDEEYAKACRAELERRYNERNA